MVQRRVRRRRLWRRTRLTTMITGGVIVVLALAFGIDRMVVSLYRYYGGDKVASPPATTPIVTSPTSSTTTTAPGPPDCTSSGLRAQVENWQETAGSQYETVVLTNISPASCTLVGYPTLGVTATDGTPLQAATTNSALLGATAAGATAGSSPTAAPVVLATRGQAWFEFSYLATCDQILTEGQSPTGAPDQCYSGATLEVTPPHATSPLLVNEPVRLAYQTSGFMVGPFEAVPIPPSPPIPTEPATQPASNASPASTAPPTSSPDPATAPVTTTTALTTTAPPTQMPVSPITVPAPPTTSTDPPTATTAPPT
jgi:Protein of unknown function (DUF4232)